MSFVGVEKEEEKERQDASNEPQTHLDPQMVEMLIDRLALEFRKLEIDLRLMRRHLEE